MLLVGVFTLVACSPNPGGDGGVGDAGVDYEWTRWQVPPDAPPASNYRVDAGIVTDAVTRLEWQQTLPASPYTWANAKTYCAGLSLGGTGWRLPTLIELESIVDGSVPPVIDRVAFPSTPLNWFWSSSPSAYVASYAWVVDFSSGGTSGLPGITYGGQVRCVRCAGGPCAVAAGGAPGAPPARYTVSADTVLDTMTALTWQRNAPTATYTLAGAGTYCSGLSLSGTGWRLPTVKELQSLVDIRAYNPAIDQTAFPSTPSSWFWPSSPYAGTSGFAWVVYFHNGGTAGNGGITDSYQVRCVR